MFLLHLMGLFVFQVRVYDLLQYEHGPDDVLILATDGLWDVLLNEEVAEAVTNFLPNCDPDDPHRFVISPFYISLARCFSDSDCLPGMCFVAFAVLPLINIRSFSRNKCTF